MKGERNIMRIQIISFYLMISGMIMTIISALSLAFRARDKEDKLDRLFLGLIALVLLFGIVWEIIDRDFSVMRWESFIFSIFIFILGSIIMYFIVIHKSPTIKVKNQKKERKENQIMKIEKIDEAYLGIGETEILGIKWVYFDSIDPFVKAGNPRLCFHVRFKNGKEDYVEINRNTYYPIKRKGNEIINNILQRVN